MIIFIILAVLCFLYGLTVYAAGSGTAFFLVWFALAIILAVMGVTVRLKWWGMIPGWIRIAAIIIFTVCAVAFIITECCIIRQMNSKGRENLDYIIVLGAQVYENGPSAVLKYRLDKAVEYLEQNPHTVCIVSGGKGANEPFTEAEGMAAYLKRMGISSDRILMETDSRTTEQNISNSRIYIEDNASVGIVTNNFHMFRALQIAKKQGLHDTCGIAAQSNAVYLPNNMLREFLAEIKFLITNW